MRNIWTQKTWAFETMHLWSGNTAHSAVAVDAGTSSRQTDGGRSTGNGGSSYRGDQASTTRGEGAAYSSHSRDDRHGLMASTGGSNYESRGGGGYAPYTGGGNSGQARRTEEREAGGSSQKWQKRAHEKCEEVFNARGHPRHLEGRGRDGEREITEGMKGQQ